MFFKVHKNETEPVQGSSKMVQDVNECVLGLVPHSIRGFLSSYNHMLPATMAFSKCTACSTSVIDLYNTEREQFLSRVFQSNTYLEEVTGLSELLNITEEIQVYFLVFNVNYKCIIYSVMIHLLDRFQLRVERIYHR